jgi:hypothetical protein
MLKKKIRASFQRIIELFTQKFVTKLSKIWVWDLGSEIRDSEKTYSRSRFPDPGSGVKKAPDPGSGSTTLVQSELNGLFEYRTVSSYCVIVEQHGMLQNVIRWVLVWL